MIVVIDIYNKIIEYKKIIIHYIANNQFVLQNKFQLKFNPITN